MRSSSRSGVTLIGVLIILMMIIGIGLGLSNLARQSRRSSHWFFQSQLAFDLASAGLREAHRAMIEGNSPARLQAAAVHPSLAPALLDLYQKVASGAPGATVTLLSSPGGQDPPGIAALLDETLLAMNPRLEVTVRVMQITPLWGPGSLEGLPSVPQEKRGTIQIRATASVQSETAMRVERTIVAERDFKLVSVLPSLLGRFALFVGSAPTEEENFVPVKMEESGATPGQGSLTGTQPLYVRSSAVQVAVVAAAGSDLDRSVLAPPQVPADFLDRQGWVFLGGAGATGADPPWALNLAHGWGPGGESPLLPGYFRRAEYKDNPTDSTAFLDRIIALIRVHGYCDCNPPAADDGLYHLHHGVADNYDAIGIAATEVAICRAGGPQGPMLDFGPLQSSALRLFGSPDRFSPTLVFGPVARGTFRKARIALTLVDGQRAGGCGETGKVLWLVPKPGGYEPEIQAILDGGYESQPENYVTYGTNPSADAYASSLNIVLNSTEKGTYQANGELTPAQAASPVTPWATSRHFPLLGSTPLPVAEGVPREILQALWEGRLENPALFEKPLDRGLLAFGKSLEARCTFTIPSEVFLRKYVTGGKLRVPGVVFVSGTAPLSLPVISEVVEGGVILAEKGLVLGGDVRSGPSREPLVLATLEGELDMGTARHVEAYLVALTGSVKLPAADVAIHGGLACGSLDLQSLKGSSASREILYRNDLDSTDPARLEASLRLFYSGEGKLAVSGAEP